MTQDWWDQNAPKTAATPKAAHADADWWEENTPPLNATATRFKDVKVAGKNAAGQDILAPVTSPNLTPGEDMQTGDDLRAWYRAMKTQVKPEEYKAPGAPQWANQALATVHNVGARGIQDVESMARHPINTVVGMGALAKEALWDIPRFDIYGDRGPIAQRIEEFQKDWAVNPRQAWENLGGDALGLYLSGKLMEATGEAAGRLPPVRAVAKYATQTAPLRAINQLIRPSAQDIKFNKEPARAILDEGIVGNSLQALGEKVNDKLHEIGAQIDGKVAEAQAANPKLRIDVRQSLKPIDDAIEAARKAGDAGLYARLNNLRTELTYNTQVVPGRTVGAATLRPTFPRNLKLTPEQTLKFKRQIGDRITWTGTDPFENATNAALGAVYGNLKDRLNANVKGLEGLNSRFADLVAAQKAITRRIPVHERNATVSLSDIVLGAHSLPVAIARKVATWPAVKTRVARSAYALRNAGPVATKALAATAAGSSATQRPDQPLVTLEELKLEAAKRQAEAALHSVKKRPVAQ